MLLAERRIASLAPFVLPMYMNVPPPPPGSGRNAKYIAEQGSKAYRKEAADDENRRLLAIARGEAQPVYVNRPELRRSSSSSSGSACSWSSASSAKSGENEEEATQRMRRSARRERVAMKAYQKGKDISKMEKKIEKAQRNENFNTDDLLWIVLLNADHGASYHDKYPLISG
jgi:hypothetical protein